MPIKNIVKSLLEKTNYRVVHKKRLDDSGSPTSMPRWCYQWAHHGLIRKNLKTEYGFISDIEPSSEDYQICERLIQYYQACSNSPQIIQKEKKDVWRDLEDTIHKDFLDSLRNNDSKKLAVYLCNMASNSVTHGISQGAQSYNELQRNLEAQKMIASLFFDRILCLAEMLGCLPLEQPEQGQFGQNLEQSLEDVINLIETELGFSILPPQIEGGQFGLKLKGGILAQRDILALDAAIKLKALSTTTGLSSFGEIGAGVGKAAFWSWKMGNKNYSIFDLPYVSLVSAFYLIKTLPSNSVVLYGEKNIESHKGIKIYPFWCFKDIPPNQIQIVLNQDSMPEMDDYIVMDYLQTMKDIGIKLFLSINQEGMAQSMSFERKQGRVSALAKQINEFQRIFRTKSWTRQGYVEELYKIN